MLFAAVRKLSQKRSLFGGFTTFMADYVDVKCPCGKAKGFLLGLVIDIGGHKCRFLPCSKRCGEVHSGGTVGGWLGGI